MTWKPASLFGSMAWRHGWACTARDPAIVAITAMAAAAIPSCSHLRSCHCPGAREHKAETRRASTMAPPSRQAASARWLIAASASFVSVASVFFSSFSVASSNSTASFRPSSLAPRLQGAVTGDFVVLHRLRGGEQSGVEGRRILYSFMISLPSSRRPMIASQVLPGVSPDRWRTPFPAARPVPRSRPHAFRRRPSVPPTGQPLPFSAVR